MAVVKMKKAFIFSSLNLREALIRNLHKIGLVQIADIQKIDGLKELSVSDTKDSDDQINKIQFLLSFLPTLPKEKKSFIQDMVGAKNLITKEEFANSVSNLEWKGIFSRCIEINKELEEIKKKKESCNNLLQELEPWHDFNLPLDEIKGTRHAFVILGKVGIEVYPWLFGDLSAKSNNFILKEIKDLGKDRYFILMGLRNEEERLTLVLKKFNYSNISLPSGKDKPGELISKTKKELTDLHGREKQLQNDKLSFSEKRQDLINLYDYYLWEKDLITVQKHFGKTEKTIAIEGWVKADDTEKLQKHLMTISKDIYASFRDPQEGEDVPTALKNNSVFGPFELIVELYGMPSYYEKDPTPLIAIFFSIIFGFCLGDAVYGIVLAIVTGMLIKKYKIREEDKKGLRLFFWVGITTIIIGALCGTWLGDLPDKLPESVSFIKNIKNSLMIVDPLTQLIRFISIALGVGVAHVFCGLGFKAYQNIIKGKFFDALFDQIVWITLIGGLIGWAISRTGAIPSGPGAVSLWSAKISAIIIILFGGRDVKNPFGRIGLGLFKLYGASAYIGDILSYTRLVALGLAGSIIAMVFNLMAFLLKDSYIGIIFLLAILFIGHGFNLIINILGAFVHTARLHYVEFFSKFYDNGGKPFKPFRMEGKYIAVE